MENNLEATKYFQYVSVCNRINKLKQKRKFLTHNNRIDELTGEIFWICYRLGGISSFGLLTRTVQSELKSPFDVCSLKIVRKSLDKLVSMNILEKNKDSGKNYYRVTENAFNILGDWQ